MITIVHNSPPKISDSKMLSPMNHRKRKFNNSIDSDFYSPITSKTRFAASTFRNDPEEGHVLIISPVSPGADKHDYGSNTRCLGTHDHQDEDDLADLFFGVDNHAIGLLLLPGDQLRSNEAEATDDYDPNDHALVSRLLDDIVGAGNLEDTNELTYATGADAISPPDAGVECLVAIDMVTPEVTVEELPMASLTSPLEDPTQLPLASAVANEGASVYDNISRFTNEGPPPHTHTHMPTNPISNPESSDCNGGTKDVLTAIAHYIKDFYTLGTCEVPNCEQVQCQDTLTCRYHSDDVFAGVERCCDVNDDSSDEYVAKLSILYASYLKSPCKSPRRAEKAYLRGNRVIRHIEGQPIAKYPLRLTFGTMNIDQHESNTKHVQRLVLIPTIVQMLMVYAGLPYNATEVRKAIISAVTKDINPDGFDISSDNFPNVTDAGATKDDFNMLVWASYFVLDMIETADIFTMTDVLINIFTSSSNQFNGGSKEIIQHMSSLGYFVYMLARISACSMKDHAAGKNRGSLFRSKTDTKTSVTKLTSLTKVSICKELIDMMSRYGFFPVLKATTAELVHANPHISEFLAFFGDEGINEGKLLAYIMCTIAKFDIHQREVHAVSKECMDLVYNEKTKELATIPFLMLVYIGHLNETVLHRGNMQPPFDLPIKRRSNCKDPSILFIRTNSHNNAETVVPHSFSQFRIRSDPRYQTRILPIADSIFRLQSSTFESLGLGEAEDLTSENTKTFSFNATSDIYDIMKYRPDLVTLLSDSLGIGGIEIETDTACLLTDVHNEEH
jgi:hypothetical protein